MATLAQLIVYLQKGYSLRCCAPGSATMIPTQSGRILASKEETRHLPGTQQILTMDDLERMRSMWEYGVIFLDQGKEILITNLVEIEAVIEQGWAHPTFGELPQGKNKNG